MPVPSKPDGSGYTFCLLRLTVQVKKEQQQKDSSEQRDENPYRILTKIYKYKVEL